MTKAYPCPELVLEKRNVILVNITLTTISWCKVIEVIFAHLTVQGLAH